jgi:5-methylcytosine-specific restriction endonuclease McrA
MPACSIDGCDAVAQARGWCKRHYTRWLRHGDPMRCWRLDHGITEKRCSRGGYVKALTEFYPRGPDDPRPRARCKTCLAEVAQEHWKNGGPERRAAWLAIPGNRDRQRAWLRNTLASRRAQEVATATEPIDVAAVFDRDGWVCGICWQDVDPALQHPDPHSASLDHILPLSRGGSHTLDNVQLAHLGCNAAKGAKTNERLPLAA